MVMTVEAATAAPPPAHRAAGRNLWAALAALVLDIALINVWNRLNAATRQPAGQT